MRPHSFFSFIPSVTFTTRLLTPHSSLLQRPTFLILYSLGFTRGWNNNLYNAFSSRATGARTSGNKDGKCSVGHYHVGASFGSFQVLFLLVTQVPIRIFLTIFLPASDYNFLTIFLHFSTSAGLSPVFRLETFPLQPPTTHPDAFLHPFIPIFYSFKKKKTHIRETAFLTPRVRTRQVVVSKVAYKRSRRKLYLGK